MTWMQLRGPAKVTFDAAGPTPVAGGAVVTAARFPSPGVYALRATANDGALSTKGDVTIAVHEPPTRLPTDYRLRPATRRCRGRSAGDRPDAHTGARTRGG